MITLILLSLLTILTLNAYDYRHCNTGKPKQPKPQQPKHKIIINDYLNGKYTIEAL